MEFIFLNQMKPGDKVRIVIKEPIDYETQDWLKEEYEFLGLDYPDGIATIGEVYLTEDLNLVKLVNGEYYLHPGHFITINNKKMKLTGNQLMNLQVWLYESADNKGEKFSYAIAKNISVVDAKIKEIKSIKEKTKAYAKFDEKRAKLAEKFAEKGQDGKPLIANGNYVITTKRKEFDKAFKEFSKDHKDVLDAYKKQLKDYNKALKKEFEVDLHLIKREDLSEDITANQRIGLAVLIEE